MTTTHCYTHLDSPVGRLLVLGDDQFVTGIYFPQHKRSPVVADRWPQKDEPFAEVREQLAEYFAGERQQFDVPLRLIGTPFQQRVWQALAQIPFGETISYAQLATRVGQPTASRAVGNANGRNPLSILVPCHRIVGASGKLTGYAGGLENKEWLLAWEQQVTGRATQRCWSTTASALS